MFLASVESYSSSLVSSGVDRGMGMLVCHVAVLIPAESLNKGNRVVADFLETERKTPLLVT